ncbi:MAG: hypothetical protein RIB98_06535 [Acidimicrobiales bacterium]
MKLARLLVVGTVVAALVAGLLVDLGDRPVPGVAAVATTAVPEVVDNGVWFCPGGSNDEGAAGVNIELVNVGDVPASAIVSGVRSGTGTDARETQETVDPGGRTVVLLSELVPDSEWMGAVVEVERGDLVVEQTYVGNPSGIDRAPCHSRTSTSWVVASGATRETEFSEQMTLLVLNPFLDDAVLDIAFDSDTGVDSLTGVVVPARRVVAIDVNEAVPVAGRVSAVIDVVAGRVAVSRLQVVTGEGRSALAVTPASADAAPVWFLPFVHRETRDDVITVVNPSLTESAEVDLEIVADGDVVFDPVLLTIRPGRSVQVRLADEARLGDLQTLSILARSLSGLPVAVMSESTLADERITNYSATVGADAAATRWVAPLEADEGGIVLYNPSPTSIANAAVFSMVDGQLVKVADVELGPQRRAVIASADIEGERPIAVVEATEPVVVGREIVDVSVHVQTSAVISGAEAVPLG